MSLSKPAVAAMTRPTPSGPPSACAKLGRRPIDVNSVTRGALDARIQRAMVRFGVLSGLRSMGMTPNAVTVTSGFVSALSIAALIWVPHPIARAMAFAVLWTVGYLLDLADGEMARQYDMTSEVGDALDHGVDTLRGAMLVVVVLLLFARKTALRALLCVMYFFVMAQLFEISSHSLKRQTKGKPPATSSFYGGLECAVTGGSGMSYDAAHSVARATRWLDASVLCVVTIVITVVADNFCRVV